MHRGVFGLLLLRLRAAVSGSALVAGLVVAAGPAWAAPAPSSVTDAQHRVEQAANGLADVQVRAEQAAEAYNGAQVAAVAADAQAGAAAAASSDAADGARAASAVADSARRTADDAAAVSERARDDHDEAVAATVAAQQALNRLAAGAYRSGGTLAMLSSMFGDDPLAFADAQEMVNRVDRYQKGTVDRLSATKAEAAASADLAETARRAAVSQAEQVAVTAGQAVHASVVAQDAARAAAATATAAGAAADRAAAAKQRAVKLVAAAESDLGTASARAADLTIKAEQARLGADAAQRGPASAGAPGRGSAAATAIAAAYREIGVPYSWGGGNANGPSRGFAQGANTVGFDCSGLTLFAYAQAGIRLDHFTGSQWNAGQRVDRGQLVPGDLMFFATNTSVPGSIHHVSIYLGNDLMIEAPHTGDVVKVASAVRSDFIGGVRPSPSTG